MRRETTGDDQRDGKANGSGSSRSPLGLGKDVACNTNTNSGEDTGNQAKCAANDVQNTDNVDVLLGIAQDDLPLFVLCMTVEGSVPSQSVMGQASLARVFLATLHTGPDRSVSAQVQPVQRGVLYKTERSLCVNLEACFLRIPENLQKIHRIFILWREKTRIGSRTANALCGKLSE